MFYESCTNIFLFQSHINFKILTHFLNTNFEKSLHGCKVPLNKAFELAFIANQSQHKKLGNFFYFPFFPTDQPFKFKKKSVLPDIKLVWLN